MKIEYKTKKRMVDSIPDGECFLSDSGTLYMKTCEQIGSEFKCIDLEYGGFIQFPYDKEVFPVKAKVVIE